MIVKKTALVKAAQTIRPHWGLSHYMISTKLVEIIVRATDFGGYSLSLLGTGDLRPFTFNRNQL
jgi:hypothetical protein